LGAEIRMGIIPLLIFSYWRSWKEVIQMGNNIPMYTSFFFKRRTIIGADDIYE